MVGIVSLHLPFRDAASRFSRRHTRQRRRKPLPRAPPRAQNGKTAIRARPRIDVFRHRGPRPRHLRRRRGHALTSDSSVSEAAFELHSSRPGVSGNPAKRACLSTMYLPNGRSDGRSSPPAAKSSRFYRRGGAKSRPAAAKSCKIAVCAGTSSIYIAQPKNGNGYSKLILQAFLPPALRIADKMPASGNPCDRGLPSSANLTPLPAVAPSARRP